jgi:hypothetical protein
MEVIGKRPNTMKSQFHLTIIVLNLLVASSCTAPQIAALGRRGNTDIQMDLYPMRGQSDEQYALDQQACQSQANNPNFLAVYSKLSPLLAQIEPPSLRIYIGCMSMIGYLTLFSPVGYSADRVKTDRQECESEAKKTYNDLETVHRQIAACMQRKGYIPIVPYAP